MERRNKTVSFYELLNDDLESDFTNQNSFDGQSLIIVDDRIVINPDDFEKIISIINLKYNNRSRMVFKNLCHETYSDLVSVLKKYNITDASVNNLRNINNDIVYKISNEDRIAPISINTSGKNAFNLPADCFKYIDNGENYDRNILDDKLFAMGIDSIVNQINYYAKNDIEKVLLLDKMLREETIYVPDYFSSTTTKEERNNHIGHKPQAALRDRSAVCDGFSNLAAFILNKAGVECEVVIGRAAGGRHAWNKVKLDNKWYYCDFTFSLCCDRYVGLSYILISDLNRTHKTDAKTPLPVLSNIDRNIIKQEQKKLENVKVLMPVYHKKDGSIYGIRRTPVSITEYEVKFNEQPKHVRRTAKLIEEKPLKRVRRMPFSIDKKD